MTSPGLLDIKSRDVKGHAEILEPEVSLRRKTWNKFRVGKSVVELEWRERGIGREKREIDI